MFHVHDHRFRLSGEPLAQDATLGVAQALLDSGKSFAAPVAGPVYGTLLNDRASLQALGATMNEAPYKAPPRAPILYLKPRNTLRGHRSTVALPGDTDQVEVGISLGIVVGRTASRLSTDNALDHIAGYVIVGDLSIPHRSVYRPSVRLRARDGFCPVGPLVVARKHVTAPDNLRMTVAIDGKLAFESTTAGYHRDVLSLLVDVTEFMTLSPGDVLTLGVPYGAPLAAANQRVELSIESLGTLEVAFVLEGAI